MTTPTPMPAHSELEREMTPERKARGLEELERVEYPAAAPLRNSDILILRGRSGTTKLVPSSKWWINRNTPVGDDADLWQRMPNNGRRYIPWSDLIGVYRAPSAAARAGGEG